MIAHRAHRILAFDGGGTSTRAGLYDEQGNLLRERTDDASNPVVCGVDRSIAVLTAMGNKLLAGESAPFVVAAGISGASGTALRDRTARELQRRLAAQRTVVTTDIHALLLANAHSAPAVIVIAGTGSSAIAQDAEGKVLQIGGRGHLMGDDGSAYAIAIEALRRCARHLDEEGALQPLARVLTREAGLSSFDEFVHWTHAASKQQIARLARAVTSQAGRGDTDTSAILLWASMPLARMAHAAMTRLQLPDSVPIYLAGGLFEGDESLIHLFGRSMSMLGHRTAPGLAPLRGHRAPPCLPQSRLCPRRIP